MKFHQFTVLLYVVASLSIWVNAKAIANESGHSTAPPLNALESDPSVMGWMSGFPPTKDKRVMQPDSNFFSFPKLRWSVCHMQELLPTTAIKRDPYVARPFEYELVKGIDGVTFVPMGSNTAMSWQQSLLANYTDGLIILHKGKVVYEYYTGCLQPDNLHAAMSMTKSLTGLVAQVLIENGQLDEHAKVKRIIPELAQSAFGDATVRQVMNMTTALKYSENYADPNADIWQYAYAANPLPKPSDYSGPVGYFEYLQTVKKQGRHGEAFGYRTVNSDVLGWIIARITNKPFSQVASEMLWQQIGTEHDANITVDALGTPFAGGGLSASLRDLARLGQLMLDDGRVNGIQIIPEAAIESIRGGGSKKAFAKAGFPTLEGGSYQSMWWVFHNEHQAYAARGVHGQTIYVDPTADMVLVRFASFPTSANGKIDPTSLPAYQAVAEYLMGK